MADNIDITPGTGKTIAADDIGSVWYQRIKVTWGPDGTANDADVANGKPLPVQLRASGGTELALATDAQLVANRPAAFAAVGTTLTRFANATPYAASDSVSNHATIGSVIPMPVTVADVNDAPVIIERIRLDTNDTGFAAGKNVRIWLYNSDPTANSGVVGGDNLTYSNKRAGFLGTFSGAFRAGNSDGGVAVCVPDEGSRLICKPATGAKTIWWQLQTLDAVTPVSGSTFIPTFEGLQVRP